MYFYASIEVVVCVRLCYPVVQSCFEPCTLCSSPLVAVNVDELLSQAEMDYLMVAESGFLRTLSQSSLRTNSSGGGGVSDVT